jgi:DUF1680 family protein
VARTFASIGSYIYSVNQDTLYTHLYMDSRAKITVADKNFIMEMKTGYPWEEDVEILFTADQPVTFSCALRVPGWCKKYSMSINGNDTIGREKDGFVFIRREWKSGDMVRLHLDMPAALVRANPKVRQDVGKTAVMRGPIVYCLEEKDNGKGLYKIYVKEGAGFTASFEKDLLGGVVTLASNGLKLKDWEGDILYREEAAGASAPDQFEEINLKWIPYYAWANRGSGEMAVWVHKR